MSASDSTSRTTPGAGETGAPSAPPQRKRYVMVFGACMAFIVVAFFVATSLERAFRPGIRTEYPAGAAASSEGTTQSTPLAASSPVGVPSPAPQPSPSPTPLPPALRQEITDAYLRFWQVRSDALGRWDTTSVPQVMAGAELERVRRQVADLQAQDKVGRVIVDHRVQVVTATETTALVRDDYTSRSELIDVKTRQVLEADSGQVTRVSFELQKIDGTWKVIDGSVSE